MKKIALSMLLLAASLVTLQAGIIDNTLATAGNLADDALNVPGDILYGPERDYNYYNPDNGYYHRHGLFRRRYYRD